MWKIHLYSWKKKVVDVAHSNDKFASSEEGWHNQPQQTLEPTSIISQKSAGSKLHPYIQLGLAVKAKSQNWNLKLRTEDNREKTEKQKLEIQQQLLKINMIFCNIFWDLYFVICQVSNLSFLILNIYSTISFLLFYISFQLTMLTFQFLSGFFFIYNFLFFFFYFKLILIWSS